MPSNPSANEFLPHRLAKAKVSTLQRQCDSEDHTHKLQVWKLYWDGTNINFCGIILNKYSPFPHILRWYSPEIILKSNLQYIFMPQKEHNEI